MALPRRAVMLAALGLGVLVTGAIASDPIPGGTPSAGADQQASAELTAREQALAQRAAVLELRLRAAAEGTAVPDVPQTVAPPPPVVVTPAPPVTSSGSS